LHTRRAVGEPKIYQVGLSKDLLRRHRFTVIARHREKRSRFPFPTGNCALQRAAELGVGFDSDGIDASDLAGFGISFEQLWNWRIGFHDAQEHLRLARNS